MKKTILGMSLIALMVVSCTKQSDTEVVKDVDTVVVKTDTIKVDTLVVPE